MKKNPYGERGFTLIELLIVIVIIGILAGILISVINPAKQQLKARDGVLVATLNKIVLEIKAFANSDVTGSGNYPTCNQLVNNLGNASACTAVGAAGGGTFTITGVQSGAAAGALATFRYMPDNAASPQSFCLAVALATLNTDVMSMTQAFAVPAKTGSTTIAAVCP